MIPDRATARSPSCGRATSPRTTERIVRIGRKLYVLGVIRGLLRLGPCSALTLLALAATSFATTQGATGRFCGAGKCVWIPAPIATTLSQRNEGGFEPASAPRPAPFYRIKIKATGEGYISRTIIWVPSRKLWFDKEYTIPPLPGFWRSDNARIDRGLRRLTRMVRPFPPPAHWARVVPK